MFNTTDVAVDLLLGTQGWRRFAFVYPAKFLDRSTADAPSLPLGITINCTALNNFITVDRAKDKSSAERLLAIHEQNLPANVIEDQTPNIDEIVSLSVPEVLVSLCECKKNLTFCSGGDGS